jgi:hypothetical protein
MNRLVAHSCRAILSRTEEQTDLNRSGVTYENIIDMCGLDVVEMIPVRRQNLQAKLPLLELAGQWLASAPRSNRPVVK